FRVFCAVRGLRCDLRYGRAVFGDDDCFATLGGGDNLRKVLIGLSYRHLAHEISGCSTLQHTPTARRLQEPQSPRQIELSRLPPEGRHRSEPLELRPIRCRRQAPISPDAVRCFVFAPHRLAALVTAPAVAVRPPSTTNCPPVVLEARSEQRNSTMLAIS